MKFQFNVNLNDQDYIDYNYFLELKSSYSKKHKQDYLFKVAIFYAISILLFYIFWGFSIKLLVGAVFMAIYWGIIILLRPRAFLREIRKRIQISKDNGKVAYIPESVLEFYEDYFKEITSEISSEMKYSAVEKVSIIENKMIYLHMNSVLSYMLPIASFESKEQQERFVEFMKTKCGAVEFYKKEK